MKQFQIFCDRCKQPINGGHDDISDLLQNEYPGKDICPNCDLQIQLTSHLALADTLENQPHGTALRKMFEIYGDG